MKTANLLLFFLITSLLYGQIGPKHFEFLDYVKATENLKPLKYGAKWAEINEYKVLSGSLEENIKVDTTIKIEGQITGLLTINYGKSFITRKYNSSTMELDQTNLVECDNMGRVVKISKNHADKDLVMFDECITFSYDEKNRFSRATRATCDTCALSIIKFTYRDDEDIDKVSMGLGGMGTLEVSSVEMPGLVCFEQKYEFTSDDSDPMIKMMMERSKNELNTFQRETIGDNYLYTYSYVLNSNRKFDPYMKEIRDKSFKLLEMEKLSEGKTEISVKYSYNQNGDIAKTEITRGGETSIYENTYDDRGRPLIQYTPDGNKSIYKYDEKGNWTSLYNYSDPNTLSTITFRKISY